jgi:hypothetical protein
MRNRAAVDAQHVFVAGVPPATHAERFEDLHHRQHVAHARDVAQHRLAIGQQRRRHQRERRVLRTRGPDLPFEPPAAAHDDSIHAFS